MEHGRHLAVDLPGVAEMRRGMITKREHEHFSLPDRLALDLLYDVLPVSRERAPWACRIACWKSEVGISFTRAASIVLIVCQESGLGFSGSRPRSRQISS